MRGGVAISVTATPAAAPRSIREVLRIIIREPSGFRLPPTMGLGSTGNRPCGIPHKVRVGAGGFGNGRESDIYNSIRESEVRGEKYVGGDASICNSLCGRDLFGLAGLSVTTGSPPLEQHEKRRLPCYPSADGLRRKASGAHPISLRRTLRHSAVHSTSASGSVKFFGQRCPSVQAG